MRVAGSRTLHASPQAIWTFLLTPNRLRQCLPGCESFEATDADTFAARLRLGVGFLKGTYTGTVRVLERDEPNRLVLEVRGSGLLGSLSATGVVQLRDLGLRTDVTFEGDASVGGRVGALGERVVAVTADRLIGLFFDCVDAHA